MRLAKRVNARTGVISDRDRLVWLDRFSRMELSGCTPGDRANLVGDLWAFFGWTSDDDITYARHYPEAADSLDVEIPNLFSTNLEIGNLQATARKLIETFVLGKHSQTVEISARYEIPQRRRHEKRRAPVRVQVEDTTKALSLLAIDLFRRSDREFRLHFEVCPSCGRPYVRVRRQLFCSTNCRWRANKKEEREQRRKKISRRRKPK